MAEDTQDAAAADGVSGAKTKPAKVLPTTRIKFENQLGILRAYGAQYADSKENVTPAQVGKIVELHADTVRLVTPFFMDTGLLARQKTGEFVPHEAVLAFNRAQAWNAETAPKKLYPVLRQTWFGKALSRKLGFQVQMNEAEAIGLLADEAAAAREHRAALVLLLDYLGAAGVIERDGDQIRLPKETPFPTISDILPPGGVTLDLSRPEPPKPSAQGEPMREIKLPKSGGTIWLRGDLNYFALTGAERKLVNDLTDLIDAFEKGLPEEHSGK